MADVVKSSSDFNLPELSYFNSTACSRHKTLDDGLKVFCQDCGAALMSHQRVGVAWLYLKSHALLAFETGLGKTRVISALLAVLKEQDEIGPQCRVLFVTKAAAVMQCQR